MSRAIQLPTTALAFALLCAHAAASPELDAWVAANTSPGEKTLCTRNVEGEFFFAAAGADAKVRLGSRLDMTGYSEAHSFSVAWIITNLNGESFVAKVPPKPLKQRYVSEGKKVYAELVEYQTLKHTGPNVLLLEAAVSKCRVRSPNSDDCKTERKLYTVKVCEVRA